MKTIRLSLAGYIADWLWPEETWPHYQEKEFIYDKLQDSVYKLQKEGATHINSRISNIYGINFDFTQKKSPETLKNQNFWFFYLI